MEDKGGCRDKQRKVDDGEDQERLGAGALDKLQYIVHDEIE